MALLHWFGASTCRLSRREIILLCSVSNADVRIIDAWIYTEAEKKPGCRKLKMAIVLFCALI
ncbi:MAG: hypothetical protein ACR2GN_08075 [Bacteroidia bacterium]